MVPVVGSDGEKIVSGSLVEGAMRRPHAGRDITSSLALTCGGNGVDSDSVGNAPMLNA